MTATASHAQASRKNERGPQRRSPASSVAKEDVAPSPPYVDRLIGPNPATPMLAGALAQAGPATRAAAVARLQREHGNAFVQRLTSSLSIPLAVQRDAPGQADAAPGEKAGLSEDDRARIRREAADSARALVEEAFRVRIPQFSNSDLVAEADRLNDRFFEDEESVGPQERGAIASTLVRMHAELHRRLTEAAAKQFKFPPKLEGIHWRPGDPLAGIPEAISPFHMITFWIEGEQRAPLGYKSTKKRGAPTSPVGGPPRSRGPGPSSGSGRRVPEPRLKERFPTPAGPPLRYPVVKSVSKFLAKMLLPDDLRAMLRIIELAWQLLENWARAKQRGIDEAAHDIAVYIAAASLADMAIKATDSPYYTIPAPDHSWFQFQLDSWLRNSPDKDAARRVHQQGIQFGAAAARTIVQNAEARAVEIRGYYKPDGRPVVVPGLAGARPGTVLLLPPQGFGIMWLRQLKKEGRTRAAIYGHLLERLRKAGVKLRVGQIGRAARAR